MLTDCIGASPCKPRPIPVRAAQSISTDPSRCKIYDRGHILLIFGANRFKKSITTHILSNFFKTTINPYYLDNVFWALYISGTTQPFELKFFPNPYTTQFYKKKLNSLLSITSLGFYASRYSSSSQFSTQIAHFISVTRKKLGA